MVAGSTAMVWQPMTSVYVRLPAQPFASVAVTVMGKVRVCVGVPDSTPVEVLSVMAVGSVPVTDQVMVPMPLVCVKVWVYALPAVPLAMVVGFTPTVWHPMTSVYVRLPAQPFASVAVTVMG